MKVNALPNYDMSDNPTGCCPRFKPEGWDGKELHFKGKKFARATTRSLAHIPLNMGSVFARVLKKIDESKAMEPGQFVTLSHDLSPFKAEHLFAVNKDLPDEEMKSVSGDFLTKVFEGPYRNAGQWHEEMKSLAHAKGADGKPVWFFYTTCPKCAKTYGKNYVVGFAEV